MTIGPRSRSKLHTSADRKTRLMLIFLGDGPSQLPERTVLTVAYPSRTFVSVTEVITHLLSSAYGKFNGTFALTRQQRPGGRKFQRKTCENSQFYVCFLVPSMWSLFLIQNSANNDFRCNGTSHYHWWLDSNWKFLRRSLFQLATSWNVIAIHAVGQCSCL